MEQKRQMAKKRKRANSNRSYTAPETAAFFGVNTDTIKRWLKKDPPRIGGKKSTYGNGEVERWMIPGKEINRVLKEVPPKTSTTTGK